MDKSVDPEIFPGAGDYDNAKAQDDNNIVPDKPGRGNTRERHGRRKAWYGEDNAGD
jgi:hypothetical protein